MHRTVPPVCQKLKSTNRISALLTDGVTPMLIAIGGNVVKYVLASPEQPKSKDLIYPYEILVDGIQSVQSLWKAYNMITKNRGAGKATAQEQDLLRSMVVMAGACLDACCKAVIKHAWGGLVEKNEDSSIEAAKILDRRLGAVQSEPDEQGTKRSKDISLGTVFLHPNPKAFLIDSVIEDYTQGSLQSVGQLSRVFKFVHAHHRWSDNQKKKLGDAFEVRNTIVHEMDVNPTPRSPGTSKRKSRKKTIMFQHANSFIESASSFLKAVDKVLTKKSNLKRNTL